MVNQLMNNVVKKSSLSKSNQWLVGVMQRIYFGRIEDIYIRNGEVYLDPPPHIIKVTKITGKKGPRNEVKTNDFWLKNEVCELFAYIETIDNGVIHCLEVQHGLPMIFTEEVNDCISELVLSK